MIGSATFLALYHFFPLVGYDLFPGPSFDVESDIGQTERQTGNYFFDICHLILGSSWK